MEDKYKKCTDQWNQIFSENDKVEVVKSRLTGLKALDQGFQWLCDGSQSVLDFGCGTGRALALCSMYGTKKHIGIDISNEAIKKAIKRTELMNMGECSFLAGGVEALEKIPEESMDGAILSNIIDNLYPEDCLAVLQQVRRILKKGGKVLIKLNPYLDEDKIKEYNIKVIKDNFLDDGMLLWNNTNEQWKAVIGRFFSISHYDEVYYKDYDQTNRLYLAIK